jgi:DNA replication and repair protein RecF
MTFLTSLNLENFRTYREKQIPFDHPVTAVIGPNAIGKTNIIESIFLLATAKSFRTHSDPEMISFGQDYARVSGQLSEDSAEVFLTHGNLYGKRVAKKKLKVNGVGRRKKDFVSLFDAVIFEPQDIAIIVGSPVRRRHFLDNVLAQMDWQYSQNLTSYQKGIRHRNKLLFSISREHASLDQLEYWDEIIIESGQYLHQKRQEFINFLNDISNQREFLMPLIKQKNIQDILFNFTYDHSIISPQRLNKYRQAEIASCRTLVGPHRDDLQINFQFSSHHQPKDLAKFGSRGQQRLGALALKLGELHYLSQQNQQKPLLLLDDIFSELDQDHRQAIIEIMPLYQTVITTTDRDNLNKLGEDQVRILEF